MRRPSSGLITAVGLAGLALLPACGGGDSTSTATVASVAITSPAAAPTIGAIGHTVQFTAVAKDAGNATIGGAAIGWSSLNTAVATVSGSGLVTAVSNGATTITASSGGQTSTGVVVTVSQVLASISVTATSAGPDTLKNTGSTRQYAASGLDSANVAIAGAPAVTWSSSFTGAATISASGLASAVADGSTNITATVGAISGIKLLVVKRFPKTLTIAPQPATINTNGGTQLFTGTAQDSSTVNLSISWTSRTLGVATVSPNSGTSTTATAAGNGTSFIVITAGGKSDSSLLTVSNQVSSAPSAITVNVGDIFFKSARNNTLNAAVDTVAVGGTVTWQWVGSLNHGVESTFAPNFANSTTKSSGSYGPLTFNTAGTYQYDCLVHGSAMTGRIVVK